MCGVNTVFCQSSSIRLPVCVIPLTEMFRETGTSSCAICARTHLPPLSSLGADRSGQPKARTARPRRGNLNLPLLIHYSSQEAFHCSFVSSREPADSFGITNDAPFTNLLQTHFSLSTPVTRHLQVLLAESWRADLFQSSAAPCILTIARLSRMAKGSPALCEMARDLPPQP